MSTNHSWPAIDGIAYGGDYNPEQWPREVWDEDVALMREAGVNLVSVGIFAWASIEVDEGVFDFTWMDELLDLLHANGISADLGTPSVSPPAWFFHAYPDSRVVTRDGTVMGFGSRGMASHASPEYRTAIGRMARALAQRYGNHPAVVMWHVHNEYGVPVGEDFGQRSVAAWQRWLKGRYQSIDALNAAWGTTFWGQNYRAWEHIVAPAATPSVVNPAMALDWMRYTDEQLRECYRIERDAIREHASQPITTNFMAHQSWNTDLWEWAKEVDVVSDDHYLWAIDRDAHIGLSLSADLTRSVGGGQPWILMEHSTSAVNWQGRNIAKRPGEMRRNSLAHLARGADGILFFQWRASRSGAEKFHSAMLPHGGRDTRVFREVTALGADLSALAEVRGSRVTADVAVLYDWNSLWAQDLEWHPSDFVQFRERMRAFYERLWRDGITVDFAHPEADLSGYRLVVAPSSYLLTAKAARNLTSYVEGGGTLAAGAFCAVVDEHDAVHPGGFTAALRDVLGLTVEEFLPMRADERCLVLFDGVALDADTWAEDIAIDGAQVMGSFAGGPGDGKPAITRHQTGSGTGWYIAATLSAAELAPVMAAVYRDAGITPSPYPHSVEVVTRRGSAHDYVVAINHGDDEVQLTITGTELLSGRDITGALPLPGGDVAVVRTTAPSGVTNAPPHRNQHH